MKWVRAMSGWFSHGPGQASYWVTLTFDVFQYSRTDFAWMLLSSCEADVHAATLCAEQHHNSVEWLGAA